MMNRPKVNYAHIVTVVHGKTEYQIVEYIYQAIRQPKKNIYAKDGGNQSIQINGLMTLLNTAPFDTYENFTNHFANLKIDKGKILDFKLAFIMDTDDCTSDTKQRYLDKSLFKGHHLYDYIMPIHLSENLEDVLTICDIKYPDSKKRNYSQIFIHRGKSQLESIATINEKLKTKPVATNLPKYLDYCINNFN